MPIATPEGEGGKRLFLPGASNRVDESVYCNKFNIIEQVIISNCIVSTVESSKDTRRVNNTLAR